MTDAARILAGVMAIGLGVLVVTDFAGLADVLGASLVVAGLIALGRIGT